MTESKGIVALIGPSPGRRPASSMTLMQQLVMTEASCAPDRQAGGGKISRGGCEGLPGQEHAPAAVQVPGA